jgi:hypothetical protein
MLRRGVLLATCAALLSGCTHTLPLVMPPNVPVKVVVRDGPHYTLDPTSHEYQRLSQWVANNRSGWRVYAVTLPLIGVSVDCGAWSLNFLGSGVLAITPQGWFTKRVEPSDYEYLRQPHGGT